MPTEYDNIAAYDKLAAEYATLVSSQGVEEYGEEFWQDYLDYQFDDCIECIK